ncbi:MAG: GNAT family N-acetyltransferase [candidate division KSB1 bacterium]|nr:GNAT family N-acetyltransferase [candidate division KSB1 bacterium]
MRGREGFPGKGLTIEVRQMQGFELPKLEEKIVEAVPFSKSEEDRWEHFVRSSNNGTLFHLRRFLSYHPQDRFRDHSLLFFKESKLLAVFPAVELQREGKRVLVSHAGASYGGFVVRSDLSLRDAFRLVWALDRYARAQGFHAVEITEPPMIYLYRPSNYLDFALMQTGFAYKKREVSSVVPLDFGPDQVFSVFAESSRRAVRRALKYGLVVRESDEFSTFYRILQKNLKLRHNVKPTHSLPELLRLKELFPNEIRLYGAFLGSTMVAGVVLFVCNPRVTLAFYISHDEDYREYRGVNLLFYEIIRQAVGQGFRFLDFGIFTVNMDPNWGLARFKESFGAQGVFRDTWHKVY